MQDLKTAYYELAFKLRYVESTGNSFQDLFSTIMEMRYPSDFVRVRPWGNVGDRKNDGYLRSKRKLFQCFAPREMKISKCIKKINDDFKAALPYWQQYFDEWIFTHNDIQGLAPDVLKLLLDLGVTNAPLVATHWGYTELLAEFKALPLTNVESLLGPAPGIKDVVDVRVEDVRRLLEHIALSNQNRSQSTSDQCLLKNCSITNYLTLQRRFSRQDLRVPRLSRNTFVGLRTRLVTIASLPHSDAAMRN